MQEGIYPATVHFCESLSGVPGRAAVHLEMTNVADAKACALRYVLQAQASSLTRSLCDCPDALHSSIPLLGAVASAARS
jgi:hypothetical protein